MPASGSDDQASAQPVSNNSEPKPDGKPPRPVSARKLAANRANAARSTGPRTPTGKARVSLNAVRHGLASHAALLPGEDPDELDALASAYHDDLRPRGALEEDLVARIVGIAWRLRRVARAEEAMWQKDDEDRVGSAAFRAHFRSMFNTPMMPGETDDPPEPKPGARFVAVQFERRGTSPLERLAVYEQRLGRALHAAIRELNVLRKLRGAREDDGGNEVPALDVTSAQNKPTEPDAPQSIDLPEVAAAPETAPSTSTDAPDGTGGHIEQNKPTVGPPTSVGGLSDVSDDPTMSLTVDALDACPHPPSP
jgi:hypothetical protein